MNPSGTHIEVPNQGDLGPEQALLSSFKSAATAVTQMYKDAMKQNRKSYQAGYEQCLQDLIGYVSSHNNVLSQRARGEAQLRNSYIPASDLIAFTREKYSQIHADSLSPESSNNQRESQTSQGYQGVQSGVERYNVPVTPTFSNNEQNNFPPTPVSVNFFQGFGFGSLPSEESAPFGTDSIKRRLNSSPERGLLSRDMNTEYPVEPAYKRSRSRPEDSVDRRRHFS